MKRALVVLVAITFLFTACSPNEAQPTATDPGKPITVKAGETFTITLESNPTTGYHWDMVNDLDAGRVEFVSNDYKASDQYGDVAGGGGMDLWTFKAVASGETQITFGYYPPSNEPANPDETVTFTVVVE